FTERQFQEPFATLSGGWRMRVKLAGLLLAQPRFLFLDEPTNHLDLDAALWLEGFLTQWPGGLVLISHDRVFLDKLTTDILEIERGKIRLYSGNYTAYEKARQIRIEQQQAAYANQQKKIQATERFIERFRYKNTKATQVQSRIKQLEKLIRIDAPEPATSTFRLRLPEPDRGSRVLIALQAVQKAYGTQSVYSDLNFTIERGQKLGLVGPNGAGKSTLLKLLAGVEAPTGGRLQRSPNIQISYYAQHQLEVLDPAATVLQTIQKEVPHWSRTQTRSYLGGFFFPGEAVDKKVFVLSGGEKARLALAKMLCTPAHLLLLDEPTNHLDMLSRDVVEQALAQFSGSIVCISHDRHFLNTVTNLTVEVGRGTVQLYSGNYDYYRWKKNRAEPQVPDESSAAIPKPPRKGPSYTERKRKRNRLEKVKRLILATEEELDTIADRFQDPQLASDFETLEKLQRRHNSCEDTLLKLLEEQEALERELTPSP
ncbi:MAG: ABC-F family ATP-binding cassette domain-containing protein, partial [FCB group bacterium]|nr:ABC-F family ATP-binding cassette domain-containing protein [FCB group bacterium]